MSETWPDGTPARFEALAVYMVQATRPSSVLTVPIMRAGARPGLPGPALIRACAAASPARCSTLLNAPKKRGTAPVQQEGGDGDLH